MIEVHWTNPALGLKYVHICADQAAADATVAHYERKYGSFSGYVQATTTKARHPGKGTAGF